MVAYVPPKQAGKYKAVASGAITNGKPVIVNSTGTVSTTTSQSSVTQSLGSETGFTTNASSFMSTAFDTNAEKMVIAWNDNGSAGTARVATVSGTSISYGTAVVFENANSQDMSMTFDSNSNRVVISYRDYGNSQYGTAIVGAVSGTDISFGTPVVFESASAAESKIAFDSSNNKVVIVYYDEGDGNKGKAIVGTVDSSDNSISFGSAVVYETGEARENGIVFDSSNNKMIIVYKDVNNSNRGTAIVGTVSGTSISFGSSATFDDQTFVAGQPAQEIAAAFDSNSNRVVIVYSDRNDGKKGTGVVGVVSGTSISFGTPVVYETGAILATHGNAIGFDSSVNKMVVAFVDDDDSNKAKFVIGTVDSSDNSISFTSATVFNTGDSTEALYIDPIGFDTTNNKIVIAFRDSDSYGKAIVLQVAGTATSFNLTSENYIGIASGGTYADTAEATIDVVGTVNKDQSGLTAGQTYYVQTDGTLGTTADDPSVVAGTAISATELIVKG
jgi:hypothetical protein